MTESVWSLSVLKYIHDSTTKTIRSIARILISIVFFAYPKYLYNDRLQSLTFIQ